MLASVHLVDGSVRSTVNALLRTPKPGAVGGLRDARTLIAAPLGGSPPNPQFGRHALVAMWDDEAALDAFLATHPYARALGDGFQARLEPIRAVPIAERTWPGVPADLPRGLVVDPGGPTAVLTIGKLRVARAVPFFQASARAERQAVGAPGLLWATGMANVAERIVSTFSLWDTVPQMRDYVTGTEGHSDAMRRQMERSFHHFGAFVRFRVVAATGGLDGRNPLPDSVTAALAGTAAPR